MVGKKQKIETSPKRWPWRPRKIQEVTSKVKRKQKSDSPQKMTSTPVKKTVFSVNGKENSEIHAAELLQKVKKVLITPSFKSFPYWTSWVVLFSVLLLFFKGIVLNVYWFVDVGDAWEVLKRYIWRLGNDILYCLVVRLIAHLAMRISNTTVKSLLVVIMSALLYVYGVDIFALVNFHSRFMFTGVGFFSQENAWPYMASWFFASLLWMWWLYISVCIMYLLAKYWNYKIGFRALRYSLLLSASLLVVSFLIPPTSSYQQNLFQIQYSWWGWKKEGTDRPYEAYFDTFKWKAERPNIIVVFAESFSSIDSLYAWGSQNVLSWFDIIARDGMFYNNFIANGCTSDSSHIALLQWVEPWESVNNSQEYTRYKSYSLWLPAFLSRQWYKTTFLSTTSLWFLGQKDFLSSLQFDTIIWNEAFANRKKYVFRAAPDEAIYQEAQKIVLAQKDKPLFLVLQTISSHKPYDTPKGNTELAAMTYSDQELLKFYRQLQSINYFDNGILIVAWDHRKMQAMWYNEIARRWKAAYGKAVFAVVWKWIQPWKIVKTPVQHRDVFSSLKRMTASWEVTLNTYYNDIFGWYQGRDAAIRYCQFVDRQYVATREDGTSWVISPTQKNKYASYIRSYYEFQQWKKYGADPITSSGASDVHVTFPGIVRIAHQGVFDEAPPNSLDAFKAAKQLNIEWVEMDVSFTRDGYPIVIHGPEIWRTKCSRSVGKKYVSDFNLQEMKDNCMLYNGQVILTLQEMLEKTQWMFEWYFIDVKIHYPWQKQYVSSMIKSIQALWFNEKIMFSSTDAEVNYQLWASRGIIAWWEIFSQYDIEQVLAANHDFVLLPWDIITPELIKKILDWDKIPVAYTINEWAQLRQLYDWWVKYFITDKPVEVVQ